MDKYAAVASDLSGGDSGAKPPKEVHHIEIHKSKTKGDHIITHHHTHPHAHPPEEHTTRGDDEMAGHALDTMGTPNPGESAVPAPAAADPNVPVAPAGSGAAAGPVGAA